ncbi:MAG: glycerol-3-phosphate acyltransferase, partial [Chloroflexota bacterium]
MPILPYAVLAAVLAYLMGAIPFAYIVARMRSVNIFEVGSGNMGTTNVIRAVGPVLGISVLVLDMLKGIGAIFLARALLPTAPNSATAIAAIFVILGHNWSIFAYMVTGRLRGGKGAATAFGT